MRNLFITTLLFIATQSVFAQTNFLIEGNQLLSAEKYTAAEHTFRKAIKSDSSNLVYQDQLALALMNQKKYNEAQKTIDKVLSIDSTNSGALWYGGMNNFLDENADLRKAIQYFEKALRHLKESQGQFYSANWFIGRSYQLLLQSNGLTYSEVSRMLDCYSAYLKLQPNADDATKISGYVKHIKDVRPTDNVKKWINKPQ
jgi:tetratricopeptide (TPR) repeat protein